MESYFRLISTDKFKPDEAELTDWLDEEFEINTIERNSQGVVKLLSLRVSKCELNNNVLIEMVRSGDNEYLISLYLSDRDEEKRVKKCLNKVASKLGMTLYLGIDDNSSVSKMMASIF